MFSVISYVRLLLSVSVKFGGKQIDTTIKRHLRCLVSRVKSCHQSYWLLLTNILVEIRNIECDNDLGICSLE